MTRPNERPATAWAEAACLLAGVLTPLAFHTLGTVGFEATKAVVVRLLALVLALGWLADRSGALAAAARGEPARALGVGGATGRPFVLVLAGFALSLVLSTVLSIQPLASLLGSWDRVQGTVTVLSWIVLGIAAALAGRVPEARRTLMTAWLVASLPVCLYALVQRAQLDPVAWLNQPLGATSTLGSSTALATYLAMLLPLSLARAVEAGRALTARSIDADKGDPGPHRRREHQHPKCSGPFWSDGAAYALAFWAGLFVLQVAALVAAQVRGGLLGAAVALAVGGVAVLWRLRPAWRRPVLAAGIVLTLGAGIVLIGGALGDGSVETDSTGQRLLIWRATLEAVAAGGWRALLGFGPETQAVALEPHFPIELATRFEDLRFDRAHNILLDTLLTTGLVGVVLLVALGGLVVRAGLRTTTSQDVDAAILAAGLLGSLAAYVAANSVAFDSNATGVLGAMIGGLLVAPSLPAPNRPTAPPRRRETPADARPLVPIARLRVTGWLTAAAVGASLLPWLIAPLLADLYHARALAMRAVEAPASSVIPEREAARWAPWQDVPLLAMALAYLDVAGTTANAAGPVASTFDDLATQVPTNREAQFQAARLALERAVAINPRDPYGYAYLGRLWSTWAEATDDPATRAVRLGRAVEAYDRAVERGPHRPQLYDEAGDVLAAWGRPEFAIARYHQAEALTRPTAERLARLGDVERARGNIAAARDLYGRALALNDRSAPASAGVAALDRAAGDLASAIQHAERAMRSQMRNWIYHRDLALLYRDAGRREEALVEARAARRYAPAWKQDELTELVDSLR